MFSQFFKLIFYKLHLFFKMSHNNLFKTSFPSEKYWFFGQKMNNLKISFLLKHPVVYLSQNVHIITCNFFQVPPYQSFSFVSAYMASLTPSIKKIKSLQPFHYQNCLGYLAWFFGQLPNLKHQCKSFKIMEN